MGLPNSYHVLNCTPGSFWVFLLVRVFLNICELSSCCKSLVCFQLFWKTPCNLAHLMYCSGEKESLKVEGQTGLLVEAVHPTQAPIFDGSSRMCALALFWWNTTHLQLAISEHYFCMRDAFKLSNWLLEKNTRPFQAYHTQSITLLDGILLWSLLGGNFASGPRPFALYILVNEPSSPHSFQNRIVFLKLQLHIADVNIRCQMNSFEFIKNSNMRIQIFLVQAQVSVMSGVV